MGDSPGMASLPSIRVYESNANYGSHRPSSRASSHASRPIAKSSGPMSIGTKRHDPPPPPLPPPRYIEDIAAGSDPGWEWGNTGSPGTFVKRELGSISLRSSLRDRQRECEGDCERPDYIRRGSSVSTIKSPPDADMYDGFGHRDEGYYSLSGSSLMHQLQGERPLEQRNLHDSSQAYDKQLLSKIGKPKTPPQNPMLGSIDASPTSKGMYYQAGKTSHQLKSLPFSERSLSTSSESPFNSRWANSPQSGPVSPGLISSAASAKSYMDFRNPSYNSSVPSSAIDSERFAHVRHGSRRSDSNGSILMGFEDASSVASHSNRGSYDHAIFSEPDSDFPMEETGGLRQLQLDDRPPPSMNVHSPNSRAGIKRRASSPPPERSHDDKAPLQTIGGSSELYQRRTSGHLTANRASPVHRFHPTNSSVSSASSTGIRNGSYASSAGLSVGGTSSISSHEQHSPGGISPSSEQHDGRDSPYITSNSLDSGPQASSIRSHQRTPSDTKSTAAIARKMSSDNTVRGKQHNAPKLQANVHICGCCPKKPKKFDTLEELQAHQLEKQYACQFCNNRFKNKNEAERHQNSLHLRRHSWSCATLNGDYQNAFHPCTAIPPNTNNINNVPPPPTGHAHSDICGYCGASFPNDPVPDWDARVNHLTNVHKFGECNQSKKFFRADHFRQHLKHSHAGTSGKWTNMLENACMKDEPALTPEAQSQQLLQQQQQQQQTGAPVANMMAGGPAMGRQGSFGGLGMGLPGGSGGMQQDRIDEMHEEM